jgi:hypothetical protein
MYGWEECGRNGICPLPQGVVAAQMGRRYWGEYSFVGVVMFF